MSTIVYDYAFIDDIKARYDACGQTTQEIENKLGAMMDTFEGGYKGMALEVVQETLMKIKEHMQLLRLCEASTGAYVQQAKADMQAADFAAHL